ncbi:hypothetical protein LEN26_011189 [Aphanomyces euteiches]|nr:hypothetical protein LEN26_011189 [Aphanomyces euteiches]KAH9126308.1 hypothetical protein AeMF1_003261 [Aphanomyces euteiches]KAH9193428.1 hypothetical protein AeNC1_004602 [Aphanomyces euteiches]
MVVYYAKKHSFLHMLKLQSADYVAMEVHSNEGSLTFLNDQKVYSLDQIVDASWSTHRTVTLRLTSTDGSITKDKFVFDCQADLFFFLVELGMEPSQFGGKVQRGSFSNPTKQHLRKSYSSRTNSHRRSARKSGAKSDYY